MKIHPIIGVLHAAFDADRRRAFQRLMDGLLPQTRGTGIEVFAHHDTLGKGSLGPWLHVLGKVCESDATHVVIIGDDNILVPHFVDVMRRCIEAKPEAILCMQSNHEGATAAAAAGARWYTTPDGFTGFGGTMPLAWAREHLQWRKEHLHPVWGAHVAGDHGVNLWAMATGRLIHKSLPSLVDHDLSLPSLDGNDHHINHSPRRPLVWDPNADLRDHGWSGPTVHLGRTYSGNQWGLVSKVTPPMARRAYDVAHDWPVSP